MTTELLKLEREGICMIPVRDQEGAKVNAVIGRRWPMDHQWPSNAVRVLEAKVAMIPTGSILSRSPLIDHLSIRRNRALCDASNAICVVCVKLTYAMPVNRRSILIGQLVVDSDLEFVAPVCFDYRSRISSVY